MSIVGPRPHAIAHNEHYRNRVAFYMLRHKVKPGITGWAQINGRDELPIPDKVQLDKVYLEHRSLWMDMKIIALTALKVLRRDGVSH